MGDEAIRTLINNLDFGEAIRAAKEGKKISRKGWNGKNMFVYYVSEERHKIGESWTTNDDVKHLVEKVQEDGKDEIVLLGHLCMFSAKSEIVVGWLASQTDILADDWFVVE